jgi:hypothetical protein
VTEAVGRKDVCVVRADGRAWFVGTEVGTEYGVLGGVAAGREEVEVRACWLLVRRW